MSVFSDEYTKGPVPRGYKRDHPAVQPHVFKPLSKTVQSTVDVLDRHTRSQWPVHDKPLSRKARRLRSTYGTGDIVNHPELRRRVVHSPDNTSRVQAMLSRNRNVVRNERGYYTDGSKHEKVRHLDVSKNRFAQSLSTTKIASPTRTSASRPPFNSPGKGEGPVGSMSLVARYGAKNSPGGHAAHNDKRLFFNEELHQNIDVVDDPVTGTTLSWPSLGGEYMGNSNIFGVEAVASSEGLFNPYSSRVDEFKKISPSQWPDEAGYTRGSAIARRKEKPSSPIVVPRGIARSMERDGIRQSRLHKMALTKRREEMKELGRWLQGKPKSDSTPPPPYFPNSSSTTSFFTEYDPSLVSGVSRKKRNNKSEFDGRTSTYGELASLHQGLTGGASNPFRKSMNLPSKLDTVSVKFAGSYSMAQSTVSGHTNKRSQLVQAVAKATKSLRLENESKIEELAKFGLILLKAPNNCPGHEVVLKLSKALVDTASSNPNPDIISRPQFVRVVMYQLDHVDERAAHNLYSCFDPNGREKVCHVEFCCCLLVIHRPSMNILTSGHYHYIRKYMESVPVLERCISLFENGRGGITKFDLRRILTSCSLTAEDRAIMDAQTDQVFKVMKIPFDSMTVPRLMPKEEFIGRNGLLVRNSFVFDEFQSQLLSLQNIVGKKQQEIREK